MKAKGKRRGKKSKSKSKGYSAEYEDGTDGHAGTLDDKASEAGSDGGRDTAATSSQYDDSYWPADDGWTLATYWVPPSETWWSGDTWSGGDWEQGWYVSENSGTVRAESSYSHAPLRSRSAPRTQDVPWRPSIRRDAEVFH